MKPESFEVGPTAPTPRAVVLPELKDGLIDNLIRYIETIDAGPRFTNAYEAIIYFELHKTTPDIAPKLESMTPNQATIGQAPFIVTCTGKKFDDASQILVNGFARATTFISDKELRTKAEMTVQVPQDVSVQVQNQYGLASNVMIFKVFKP